MATSTVKRLLLAVLPVAALLHVPGLALADDQELPPPPPPPPGEPIAVPVYTAPLSQETQTTYVPQSVALSGPEEMTDFDPSRPAPLGYTAVERPRKGLIIGGGVALGVSYGISAMTAAIGEDISGDGTNEVAAMWIPVAGPFLQIANTDSATAKVFLVGLGGAQTAGAIMLYYGLTTKKRVFVRNDLVGSMTVTPMVGDGASGMVVSGRF
jgi:hypothetical protein